ncbi:hypothetical protein [Nostoc sp.]|uniref:hypothetical protein n=1 Tax=Nostoc sp. TaxID=1180 RepID=UPI002FF95DF9
MTKRSYGDSQQERARRLLEDLLNYANDDPKVKLSEKLTVNWAKNKPQLAVTGTLESLVELTKADGCQEILNKPKIENAIDFFENYLEILTNFSQKGVGERQFTFTLWDTDKEKNLNKFDEESKCKDSEKLPNRRTMSNSHPQAEGEIQSNPDNLGTGIISSDPSPKNMRNKLEELRKKCQNLEDTNQDLNKRIKTTTSHLTITLNLLAIFAIPIAIDSKAIYDYLNYINPKNNSSVSSPSNTNNSGSNTSASNLPDLSRQTKQLLLLPKSKKIIPS